MSEQKCKKNRIELIYSSKIQNNEEKIHKKKVKTYGTKRVTTKWDERARFAVMTTAA
jgi:hypothetical protein